MIRLVLVSLFACAIAACGTPTSSDRCRATETDVGCGGGICPSCGAGRRCVVNADCISGLCAGGVCASDVVPTMCSDGVRDGNESDVDCGGSCSPCVDGRGCASGSDCLSQTCSTARRCVEPPASGPPDTAGAPLYSIDPGASVAIVPGTLAGYGITANVGGSYRMVWTGDSNTSAQYREFYGSIWTSGTFASVVPGCSDQSCPIGSSDYISAPYATAGGERVDFDTFAIDNIEGFDFSVSVEPVYFDLYIDGQQYPSLVYFSSSGVLSSTASFPFGLTTH